MTDVYRRTAVGPFQTLSDYKALGYDEAIRHYEQNKTVKGYEFEGLALNYIDGSRTVGQLIRELSLEYREDMNHDVLNYLKLLEAIGLITKNC